MHTKLAFLLLLIASGCASPITTSLPANHFITPESSGGFLKGSGELGFGSGARLTMVPDALAIPASTQSSLDKTNFAMADIWVGLLERLDFQLINQNLTFGLKYQILGDTALEAKAKNFSLAVSALAGSSTYSDTYTDSSLILPTITTGSSKTTTNTYDLEILAGYRFVDDLLIYGGPFYSHQNAHGTLVQNPNTGAALITVNYSGIFQQYGGIVGGEFDMNSGFFNRCFFKSEFAIAGASGNGPSLNVSLFAGAVWGVRF